MDQTDQGLGAVWREKSFGQRLKFGAGGGKFVPLGPRTIFLDHPKHPINIPIIRKNQKKMISQSEKTNPIRTQTNPISNPTTVFLLITQEIATHLWQNISAIRNRFVRICIPANGKTIIGGMSYENTTISWYDMVCNIDYVWSIACG